MGGVAALGLLFTGPADATHPRPKGATPFRVALVPAYSTCTAPNRTHGPPLAFPSCNPPAQTSAQATVGTPDAYGGAANSDSFLRLGVILCQSNCPNHDSDILVDIRLNDVRCVPTGSRCGLANGSGPADYSGEWRFSLPFRLTDHWNATTPFGGTDTATVQDFAIGQDDTPGFPGPCAQTASTSTGATCSFSTSFNALIPGSVKGAKRSVWELHAARIYDGGADGDGDTTGDNAVFARPGVFVP